MKNVLLINPPSGAYIRDDRCQVPAKGLTSELRTPLDLAYVAAMLEESGVKCVIRDYPAQQKSWDDFRSDLAGASFDALVISVTTPTLLDDLKACSIAKQHSAQILTLTKGAHFSACDRQVMQQCADLDIVIRQEYELAARDLARNMPLEQIAGITYRFNGSIVRTADRPAPENLDYLPLPARHLLNNRLYVRPDTNEMMTAIQTNKGCPAKCVYCLVRTVSGGRIIMRSPEKIAQEMQVCIEEFGIRNFYFRADTFTWNKNWMIQVCKSIIDKKLNASWVCNSRVDTIDEERILWLKKAGCWMIGFGIESGDQEILNKMGKQITLAQAQTAINLCRKLRIKTYLFWVLGLPWETERSIKNTLNFSRKIKGDFAEFHIAYPFPGTAFYKMGLENGLFKEEDLYRGDVKEGIVRSYELSSERLRFYQRKLTRAYYLDAGRIMNLLKGARSPGMVVNYLKKGISVLVKTAR